MRLAIVGAGAAGAFAALAVRDRIPDAEVFLFDRADNVPRGVAYSFPQPWLRLNIPASKMGGVLERDPTSFAEWVERRHGLAPSEYVARYVYGDYLSEALEALAGCAVFHFERHEITAICPLHDGGGYQVFAGNTPIEVDGVILCTGHLPPSRFLEADPRVVQDVWAPRAMEGIDPNEKVILIGTGATAVDVVLTLRQTGHRGLITMISPHGLLPQVDAPVVPYPDFYDPKNSHSPLTLLRLIRSEIDRAKDAGVAWQNVVNSLRRHTTEIWQGWSRPQRKQFLRHAAQRWLIHRHRLPPDVAETLGGMICSKALEVRRARYKSLKATSAGLEVQLVGRVAGLIVVDRVLNCTGPSFTFAQACAPLYKQLFRDGLARQDELGLGLAVDDESQMLSQEGQPQRGFYVLGSATRGQFWETIAVPDIRLRASMIANHIQQWNARTSQVVQSKAIHRGGRDPIKDT